MKVIVIDTGDVIIDFSTRETSLEVLSLVVKHKKPWYAAQPDFHQKKCSNSRTLPH